MTWTCQRQTGGVKCHHVNEGRKKKCQACGKPRPARKRPAHMAALDVSYEEYITLNGGEVCGMCGAPPPPDRRLDRDHDHTTGRPRGLLCRKHNRMLKRWLTPEFMQLALPYLEKSRLKSHDMTSHPRHISSEL